MSRIVLMVMAVVAGLWVAGQAANTMKIVERRHSIMMEMAGK